MTNEWTNDETTAPFEVDNKATGTGDGRRLNLQTTILTYHEELDERVSTRRGAVPRYRHAADGNDAADRSAQRRAMSEDEVTLTCSPAIPSSGRCVELTYTMATNELRDRRANHRPSGPGSPTGTSTTLTCPDAVTDLVAEGISTTEIKLTWTKPDDGRLRHYRLPNRGKEEPEQALGTYWRPIRARLDTMYTHGSLTPNTTRHYQVFAINSQGTGPASNTARPPPSARAMSPTPPPSSRPQPRGPRRSG